ncbi:MULTISPECIES: hypothetical protein [unclassified Streptomyces]|uniref:Uncharacterized protein n=1 Tax=Streptomyces sp. R35 TaxID=3238630 RepID=A0AB39SCG7_9ACTN|nr:hypothetical protein OG324_27235 [Streptomyces sp. NBC_01236]
MKDPRDRSPDGAELRHALQDLSTVERWAERVSAGGRPEPYTSPETLEGPEFSVDTETVEGMHSVAAITDWPPHGNSAPAELDDASRAALRSLVRSLLDLAGHESGPARTHVVLAPGGPRVVACLLGEEALVTNRSRDGSPGR